MNKKEYLEAVSYLEHIMETDIPTEVKGFVEEIQKEVLGESRGKKEHREKIRALLHERLALYSRSYFYERVRKVVDYCNETNVKNNNTTSKEEYKAIELVNQAVQKMEGILVTTSYLGIIEGYTRQNIHVLVKKDLYENHLVGESYGFKLIDVLEGGKR